MKLLNLIKNIAKNSIRVESFFFNRVTFNSPSAATITIDLSSYSYSKVVGVYLGKCGVSYDYAHVLTLSDWYMEGTNLKVVLYALADVYEPVTIDVFLQ